MLFNNIETMLDFATAELEDKNISPIIKMRDSFVYKEEFQQKRFNRFIEKTKDSVLTTFKAELGSINISSFNELLRNLILLDYTKTYFDVVDKQNNDTYEMPSYIKKVEEDLREQTDCSRNETLLFFKAKHTIPQTPLSVLEKIMQFILDPTSTNITPNLNAIINEQCKFVCLDYIRNKSITDKLNEDNYFQYIPKTVMECFLFFEKVLNGVFDELLIIFDCNYSLLSICGTEVTDDLKNKISEYKESLEKEKEQLNDIISEQKKEIENLRKQLKEVQKPPKKDEKDAKIKKLIEDNNSIERSKRKIQKNYDDLFIKYNNLLEKLEEKETIEAEIQPNEKVYTKQLDYNGVYLFIGGGNKPAFKNLVKETFPNAIFTDSNLNLSNRKIDMAICLTSYVSHSTYNYLREECKIKNIPFLHCKFMNFDIIQNEMLDLINN